MSTTPGARGSHALGDEHRKGGAWWKWLLALLLFAAAIVVLILVLTGGKDDNKSAVGPAATAAATTPGAAAPAATSGSGTLTGGGRSLLGSSGGSLSQYVGTPAEGKAIKVLSVIKREGFFVGASSANRVYIEYGAAVGANEAAHDYQPVVGDTVNLTGPVRPAPRDPATALKLDAADAQLVTTEGGYVNASKVAKAG